MSAELPPDIAIQCRDVRKTYVVYRQLLKGLWKRLFKPREAASSIQRVEALKGINLDIKRGQVFGLLGPNGAGKSTLLACIAGISPVTSGSIKINGTVQGLLQIGVGFHPYLTGRENIVIGMVSMGASVEDATEAIDAVLEFADLASFGDMPFYTYSSGMKSRLQFAVAVHRTPEILILDEALSAGDGFFHARASRRIEQICESGSTVLLVTHSIYTAESLCDRIALLDKGNVVAEGGPAEIGAMYRKMISAGNTSLFHDDTSDPKHQKNADQGIGAARILAARNVTPDNLEFAVWNRPFSLVVELEADETLNNPRFRVDIYHSRSGVLVSSFGNACVDSKTMSMRQVTLGTLHGKCKILFSIPALPLGGDTYYWSFALMPAERLRKLETDDDAYVYRRVMGHFQVESFPQIPSWIGRTVITETPVDVHVDTVENSAALTLSGVIEG